MITREALDQVAETAETTPEDLELEAAFTKATETFLADHPDYDPPRAIGVILGSTLSSLLNAGCSHHDVTLLCLAIIERHALNYRPRVDKATH